MLKKNILFSIVLVFNLVSAGEWYEENYIYDNFNLPYQLYKPKSIDEKIPLVIYLHGSGEVGRDNEKQMYSGTNIGPQYFSSEENQRLQKSYLLAPQTPSEIRWASKSIDEYDFQETPLTPSMAALLSLIDNLERELKIDSDRIYIAGLSRGGQGVWNAAMNRPDKFAAIVPIAGSGSPKDAFLLRHIPIWVFHGSADKITPIKVSENMVKALRENEGNVKFTVIENGNHESAWKEAHKNTNLWEWMLSNIK